MKKIFESPWIWVLVGIVFGSLSMWHDREPNMLKKKLCNIFIANGCYPREPLDFGSDTYYCATEDASNSVALLALKNNGELCINRTMALRSAASDTRQWFGLTNGFFVTIVKR